MSHDVFSDDGYDNAQDRFTGFDARVERHFQEVATDGRRGGYALVYDNGHGVRLPAGLLPTREQLSSFVNGVIRDNIPKVRKELAAAALKEATEFIEGLRKKGLP